MHRLARLSVVALFSTPIAAPLSAQTTTSRISVDSTDTQGNNWSGSPSISADGRFVAFASDASNLTPGDTNGLSDVFVRDRQLGTTELVSVDSNGAHGNSVSRGPKISADGRYVAFASFAGNLVGGDTNGVEDIFVRDRLLGTTERVSIDSSGTQANSGSSTPSISDDGRFVAFASDASNLVVGGNGFVGIFVRDRLLGTTEHVSISSAGTQATANCEYPSISADGRFVAFDSVASNLTPGDTNGLSDVFVRDRQLGTTQRASVGAAGVESDGDSSSASLSGDGRFVAFASDAMNLVPGVTIGWIRIYIYYRQTSLTQIVSVDSLGVHANSYSGWPSVSADGRFVAFSSIATNLVPADLNNKRDVFLHDMQTGATILESSSSSGVQGNGDSGYLYNYSLPTDGRPAISADGLRVAFESVASNLVLADTNVVADVFLSDRTCAGSVFTYCTAKTNSLGCVPSIGSSGLPTQSGSDNFYVTASNVLNNKLGMMLWSLGPGNSPFFGGTLCLQQPIVRTPAQVSGGSTTGNDCTGGYAFHFTQGYMQQHLLSVGTVIYAQYWSRDPGFAIPNNIGLTNGLQFTICP